MKKLIFLIVLLPLALGNFSTYVDGDGTVLYPEVSKYFSTLKKNFRSMTSDRESEMNKISQLIVKKKGKSKPSVIVLVTSNNSSSDQLAQVILQAAATYYKQDGIKFYSAGNSSGSLDERIIANLTKAGFKINSVSGKTEVKYSDQGTPISLFPKTTDDPSLPKSDFYTILLCPACSAPANSEYTASISIKDLSEVKDEQEFQQEFQKLASELTFAIHTLKEIK